MTPVALRYPNSPDSVASLLRTVRADKPASPSARRTTLPRRGARWNAMNAITSAVLTSAGSASVNSKNTFKSNPVAKTVFGRARAATNLKYSSSKS